MAAARCQLDEIRADVGRLDADIVAPGVTDVADLRRRLRAGIPQHGGTAAAGGDVDAARQAGIAQHVVATGAGIDAVAAAGVTRVAQVPVALLDMRVAAIELVQVGQPVQAADFHLQRIADIEVVVQRLGEHHRLAADVLGDQLLLQRAADAQQHVQAQLQAFQCRRCQGQQHAAIGFAPRLAQFPRHGAHEAMRGNVVALPLAGEVRPAHRAAAADRGGQWLQRRRQPHHLVPALGHEGQQLPAEHADRRAGERGFHLPCGEAVEIAHVQALHILH